MGKLMRTFGCLAAGCVLTTAAYGGVVAPGGSVSGEDEDANAWPLPPDAEWRGELLGQRSEAYELIGEPGPEGEPGGFARGTFTSSVYRDAGTGGLAFLYSLDMTDFEGIIDQERASIRSFATFTTDVSASRRQFVATRSADGASLDYAFNLEGIGGDYLVRTDATAFDENGSFFLAVDFEPGGIDASDTFAAFQPIADDGGPGPGPNPIPLPPAAWAALATMGAFGAGGRLRTLLRRTPR